MRKSLFVILLALFLAVPALGAPRYGDDNSSTTTGAMGGSHGNQTSADSMHRDEGSQSMGRDRRHGGFDELNATEVEHGLERGEKHGLFSKLTYSGNQASGRYLSFGLNATTGAASTFNVQDQDGKVASFFSAITPSTFTNAGPVRVTGSLLRLNGTGADLAVHNNPTAALTWHASAPVTFTFRLASDASVAANSSQEIKIASGIIHGHIVTTGVAPLVLVGSNATVNLAAGESVIFRAHPAKGGDNLHDELAALKSHHLGAVLRIADAGGVGAEDGTEFDVHAVTKAIRKGHVEVEVDSAQHEGRVIFLTIDGETLDPTQLQALAATLNGTLIPNVKSVANVTAATSSTVGAVAFVKSADGLSVVVALRVPHFSSYTLALAQAPSSGATSTTGANGATYGSTTGSGAMSTSQGAPALGLSVLVALVALGALARRRSA